LHPCDTIAALASPAGHAARGIVRVSGPATCDLLHALFTPAASSRGDFPRPRAWCYPGALRIVGLSVPCPAELYLWPDHRSYTGQPLAELHTLSSPPILEAI